jgi:hypothetical protein
MTNTTALLLAGAGGFALGAIVMGLAAQKAQAALVAQNAALASVPTPAAVTSTVAQQAQQGATTAVPTQSNASTSA